MTLNENQKDDDLEYLNWYAEEYLLDTGAMFEADINSGEGNFIATKELEECNNLLKLDIVNDWLGMLTSYYDNTFLEWQEEMEKQLEKKEQ
jgi:hypothetical protein